MLERQGGRTTLYRQNTDGLASQYQTFAAEPFYRSRVESMYRAGQSWSTGLTYKASVNGFYPANPLLQEFTALLSSATLFARKGMLCTSGPKLPWDTRKLDNA